jgi:DMSO reductase anchor subunit
MHPALSVILLTTLIGAGQGLFLALYASLVGHRLGFLASAAPAPFHFGSSALALTLLLAGLIASFFHLGHPERAWRTATCWRTSWLSREVIALPLALLGILLYGMASYLGAADGGGVANGTLLLGLGTVGALLCLALFVCTGMIYACMRFLQEWATPLTVLNFTLLGSASGFTLAAALASVMAPDLRLFFTLYALLLTVLAWLGRAASLWRNARLRRKSTLQTAIGVRHTRIRQLAQGAMGGSFNTREFFHGRSPRLLVTVKWLFLGLVFALPVLLLGVALASASALPLQLAAALQLLGLIAERWYFFADAQHAQNLYYQAA